MDSTSRSEPTHRLARMNAAPLLAETGSNVLPWLIGAGVIIVLGAIALAIGQVVRSRRAVVVARDDAEPAEGQTGGAAAGDGEADAGPDGEAGPTISPDDRG